MPAVGLEARRHVLAEGERGVAVDGDVVVVVEQRQLAEPQVPGERGRLVADALHQVAVAGERAGAVVDDPLAGAVEARGQEPLGDRHADRVADPLAERAGGDLDARGVAALGVARRPGPQQQYVVEPVESTQHHQLLEPFGLHRHLECAHRLGS